MTAESKAHPIQRNEGADAALPPTSPSLVAPAPEALHAVIAAIERKQNSRVRALLMIAVHAAVRPAELARAQWQDIDLARMEWRVDASTSDRPRLIALSSQAERYIHMIWCFPRSKDSAFRTEVNQSADAFLSYYERAANGTGLEHPEASRSLFSRGTVHDLGIRREAIEAALGAPPEETADLWQSHPAYQAERREVMQRWSNHVDHIWYQIARNRFVPRRRR